MPKLFILGLLSPFLLTGCFFDDDEHLLFKCESQDSAYVAVSSIFQGGGAAGAQYANVYVKKSNDKDYRAEVLTTSTSDKLILEWDKDNNLLITVDKSVSIHKFKNYFDSPTYWDKKGYGRVSFQYKEFKKSEEVSLCIN